jgi:hypothetical protein
MAPKKDDTWEQRQKEFVLNSELISGRGFEDGGEEAFWDDPGVKAHLEIAKILNKPGGNFVGVWLINSALTRQPYKCTRTGIPGLQKGLVPESKDIPAFIERHNAKIRSDLEHYRVATDEHKDDLAWNAHDEVFCAAIFNDGNSRTARLLYNHVRTLFGLDTFVIRYDKSREYYAKVQDYRHGTFLPKLKEMQTAA